MTLQLAVRITGDASSLVQATREATEANRGMTSAIEASGAGARDAATGIDRATAAAKELAAAEREAAAASKAAADAAAGRGAGARPAPTAPASQPASQPAQPAPVVVPMPGRGPVPASPAQGAAAGFRPDQWKQLGFQANDIATSLASGIPITQVLAQQGGQVAQVLGDAPGGIAGGLRIVAERAAAILTPVRLVAGGFVGLGATVAALGVSWASSQKEIEQGLTGIGAMSRATAGDINRIASAAAGGNLLSTGQARGVATAIAATGKVDVSNIGSVAGLAPGYARLLGKDVEEAGQDLARIFSDPVKGAEELNARIGGLDASTKNYVRTLVEQGERQEAIRVMVRAFAPDIQAAADKTSAWAKAWNYVKSAADAAGGVIAKPFVDGSLEQQIADARKVVSGLEGQLQEGTGFDPAGQLPAARKKLSDLLKRQDAETVASGQKAAAELSRQADEAVRALQPEIDQLEALTSKLNLVRRTQGDLDALSALSASGRRQLTDAIEAARGGIESFVTAEEKARASEALTIRSIEARTAAQKATIAADRERLSLAGQAISEEDRQKRIDAASRAVFAQSTRESEDRLRSANDNLAGAGLSPYQRQIAEIEARYRRLAEATQGNLPALANDQKAKAAELAALGREAVGGPMREANRGLAEQTAALKLQQDAFGASTEAAERMAAAQRLINDYTRAGVPITADMRKAIDDYAAATGRVAAAQEDLTRRQREVIGSLDEIRGGLRGGLTGVFGDLMQGRSPLANLAASAQRTALGLIDRTVSVPLVANLFGQEGKAGGGLFGDVLGGLFGKAQGVSNAQITAGVVNVTGPVAGLGGLGSAVAAATGTGTIPGIGSSATTAGGILSGLTGSRAEVADYVRKAAQLRGIDPDVATRVINQESGFNVAARNLTSAEQSYGPMQLNTMGGVGEAALKAGINVRDPSTWREQIDFGMDVVKRDGWRQWYGARDVGISRWEGIDRGAPIAAPASSAVTGPLSELDTSLKSIGGSATSSAQGLETLAGGLTDLPGSLNATADGLTKVGSSLGSGGSGGGLLGAIAGLFGGGGGTVAAAGGGHIRGPGTGTSDSIPAWLSDGEFVVNAKATARHLPLLHAINQHRRMPAFAAGGLVGAGGPGAAMPPGGANVSVVVNERAGGDAAQVRTERGHDGNPRVIVDMLSRQQAAEISARRGPLFQAVSSGPQLRG